MTLLTLEYWAYHQKIVELLVEKTGEEWRYWWDKMNEYIQEFEDGESPEVVAAAQIAAMKALE